MLSLVKASLSKRQDEGYKSCELDSLSKRQDERYKYCELDK